MKIIEVHVLKFLFTTCLFGFLFVGGSEVVRCSNSFPEGNRGIISYLLEIIGTWTNNTISIRCQDGYNLTGRDLIRCYEHGQWDKYFWNCSVVQCSDVFPHRDQWNIEWYWIYNISISLPCQGGYNLTRINSVLCNESEKWDGALGDCSVVRCPDLFLQRYQGVISYQPGIEGYLSYNTTASITCQRGYNLTSRDLVRCNESGEWDGTLGECFVVRCPDLFLAGYRGIISYQPGIEGNFTYNATVSIRCEDGYLTRRDLVRCNEAGEWDGTLEDCSAVQCMDSNIERLRGVLEYRPGIEGNLTYNTTVSILCQGGYYLTGRNLVRCNEHGQWDGILGNCNVSRCKDTLVQPIHGELFQKAGIEGTLTYNTTVLTRCQEGYKLVGGDLVRCNETGQWEGSFGTCIVVRCPDLFIQENRGVILYRSGIEGNSTYNTMVSIRCLIGYNLTRRDPVVCNKYGQWNGTLGNCSAVRCADLNIQRINGVVLYQSGIDGNLTYNTTVSIRCQGGYYLTGSDLVRCNEFGQWEGTLGNCFVLRCKDTLVQPIHGERFIKAGIEGTWTYNTTVLTRCQEGYKLMGADLVRCNETGEWGGSFGACIASQQMTMASDDNKQIVLLLSIFVPLCFILIATNIVTCLRLHGCACFSKPASENIPADITIASNYGPGYEMEGLKGNNDNVHLDGDKTYDELQAQERGKSLYDHLKYAKGSYGDTSKGNRVYENISVSNSQ